MENSTLEFSEALANAAQVASDALVHLAEPCRRGGTGFVYADEGVIVTTARAVSGRSALELVQGDKLVTAEVVGFDAATDVGVVRAASPLGKAPAWASSPARLGSLVLAGSRPGRAVRVRLGVVAQVGGAWHTPRGGRIERYVETDLAPEPGFSGGLSFDAGGAVIGMASAGLLRGTPLLVERETVERIVSALLTQGRVQRGYLGVGTQAVRLSEAARSMTGQDAGLLVVSVRPNSPAERAGLLQGDVLLSLGNAKLTDVAALQAGLEDVAGQRLALSLVRAGQLLTLEVTAEVKP
jgi:S1-C subfamily serine protease